MNILRTVKKIITPNAHYNPPGKGWVQFADLVAGDHTPDLPFLEQFEFIRLFVYDRMKKNHSWNKLLGPESEFVAHAFTKHPFCMYNKDLGKQSFPVAIRPQPGSHLQEKFGELRGPAYIRGEIHKVRPLTFRELDREMENRYVFRRERIRLLVPTKRLQFQRERYAEVRGNTVTHVTSSYTEERVMHEVRAFAYIGMPEYWGDMLADNYVGAIAPSYLMAPSEMRRHHNIRLDPYYIFDKPEFNAK